MMLGSSYLPNDMNVIYCFIFSILFFCEVKRRPLDTEMHLFLCNQFCFARKQIFILLNFVLHVDHKILKHVMKNVRQNTLMAEFLLSNHQNDEDVTISRP